MQIIYREKGTGKTTELIKLSAKERYYIACKDHKESIRIVRMAEEMQLNIPFPITFDDLLRGQIAWRNITGIVIDDANMLLSQICNCGLAAITMTVPAVIIKESQDE